MNIQGKTQLLQVQELILEAAFEWIVSPYWNLSAWFQSNSNGPLITESGRSSDIAVKCDVQKSNLASASQPLKQ